MFKKAPRLPGLLEPLISLGILISALSVGIIVFEADPHVPMFIGVIGSCIIALYLGYGWDDIEKFMMSGIGSALPSCCILMIVGILIGVWVDAGIVPTMIYYGLKVLHPAIFLVACVLICSITSISTGTSWGTMGTIGVAMMGIGYGLGMNPALTAGAIISGAYFGDKMSPLSETTNLAPAMAGTNVVNHIKAMMVPTLISYSLALLFFAILGYLQYNGSSAELGKVTEFSKALNSEQGGIFHINPLLLIPPLVVIGAVAMKMPAMPGITLGIIVGAILGLIIQPECSLGSIFTFGMKGYSFSKESLAILQKLVSKDTCFTMTRLLESGGISGMMFSISMTIIAMMFGGVMEKTHQLEVLVNRMKALVSRPGDLVALTSLTCICSNITMPEQYISIVVPGRMYAEEYKKLNLPPELLSSTLEGSGTVTSVLVPWNTCGVYVVGTLGIQTYQYLPYAIFNWTMPIVTVLYAYFLYSRRKA